MHVHCNEYTYILSGIEQQQLQSVRRPIIFSIGRFTLQVAPEGTDLRDKTR